MNQTVKNKTKNKLQIGLWQLNLLMSLLFVTAFNVYFWQELYSIVKPTSPSDLLFILSIFVLLVLMINLVLNLLTSAKTYKITYVVIFTLSAISFYYISQYSIVIDKEMIRNIMETNASEAKDLIGLNLFLYLTILGLLPMVFILKTKMAPIGFLRQLLSKLKVITASLVVMGVVLYISYPSYASLARGNRHLSHLIVPTNFIFASLSYINEQFKSIQLPFDDISKDAIQSHSATSPKKVTIMIIGETARADRFSINGYSKETNPKLKSRHIANFKHTSSCGTSTAISLPCIFSHLERKTYNHKTGKNSANLLDFFKQVGIDVQWRDNNTGCKGICDRTEYVDLSQETDQALCSSGECYDEILLKGLSHQILANTNDQVIILHQKGSHGPAYHLRYPPEFEKFKPTCQSVQLQKCSAAELNNSYDNTILYTDHFINETMNILDALPAEISASLIYISDHGESLGENNLYLHGTPYLIAPEAQTHVPFFYWTPDASNHLVELRTKCLINKQDHPVSHDHIFHSMIGYMDIETPHYDERLDLFSSCKSKEIHKLAAEFNSEKTL
ncbi:phosphoethanolamine transferase [Marinicella litoralis]|uniref:Phosphatidylethanolamine:Kdo2-lipid A phosphoethanolamine transferase n=1 Tax=Marinicella litoralis TaxID=644220 RepID=A0A4R6XJ49_9GAMM|nr:phosphoethanolamine--lipid A transferase [Marinicella litoralis]TDR17427.1 phosphatidylethanolamine:Kdo2-lipid A phosphoethanolamine transferase [Marinicella litoralis]